MQKPIDTAIKFANTAVGSIPESVDIFFLSPLIKNKSFLMKIFYSSTSLLRKPSYNRLKHFKLRIMCH